MNNLMKFDNKDVEIINFNGQALFNPKDVAECLDIKNINENLRTMSSKQVVKLKNSDISTTDFRKLNNAGENFLTEAGVYKIIFKSRKAEAERFQDWVTDTVLPSIRKNGGYIATSETMTDDEIMAKALLVAQSTIQKKNELIKAKEIELIKTKEDLNTKNNFVNQISASHNSMLVRDIAHLVTKNNIKIGEKRLWEKLRTWGLVFKNSTKPMQKALEQGLFEVSQFGIQTNHGVQMKHTTRVTGKGQKYIIERLLKEQEA